LKGEFGSADYAVMMERKPRRRNEARRLKIASGLVQGKSMAEIAGEEGVSRQTIWKQAGSAGGWQIIVAAVNGEIERLTQMFDRMLAVIEEAFEARVRCPSSQ
jgi:transposase